MFLVRVASASPSLDISNSSKPESLALIQKNVELAAAVAAAAATIATAGIDDVSNADFFDAIVHAVAPGPLDIPALYRTYAALPSLRSNGTLSVATGLAPFTTDSTTTTTAGVFLLGHTIRNCTLHSGTYWRNTDACYYVNGKLVICIIFEFVDFF